MTLLSPSPKLTHDGYVVDFGVVKKSVRAVCKSLNERVIVPLKSDVIEMFNTEENGLPHLRMECEDKAVFLFPNSDCFMAPIAHSTVEEIALYMYGRIVEGIGGEYLEERNVNEVREGGSKRRLRSESYYLHHLLHSSLLSSLSPQMVLKISEAPGQSAEIRLPIVQNFNRQHWEESGFNGKLRGGEGIKEWKPRGCCERCGNK